VTAAARVVGIGWWDAARKALSLRGVASREGGAPRARNRDAVSSLRRWTAHGLNILAVVVVLAALARFVVLPLIGHPTVVEAPPVALETLGGGRFDLAHRRGQVVFLDFWASWCDPCRASIPMVQRFARTHPGVTVESIDVGEDARIVRPFAREFTMRDVALDPDERVAKAFAVDGFPTLIAIDGKGRIRARWIGFDAAIESDMGSALARFAPTAETGRRPSRPG
jgi:thiol-disulfide isomerase/thioredoxin